MKNNGALYALLAIFALLVLSGFYFIFEKISNLRSELKNFELSLQILEEKINDIETANKNPGTENQRKLDDNLEPTNPINNETEEATINAAILFEIQSSPILQPQTKITMLIEKVAKLTVGTIKLSFKAFTNEATTYSTIEPRDFFELVNLTGDNQRPLAVNGQFTSIPPKNSAAGEIIFKIEPNQNTFILQVGDGENLKFYEFNFSKKTYKETVLG